MSWSTRCVWGTGLSADSAEWCPVEPHRDLLVCATYQLQETEQGQDTNKQSRVGKIYLFSITDESKTLSPIQTVETVGVLDQKWCYHPVEGWAVLAVVTSVGTLQIYRLREDELQLWLEHQIGEDVLALSVDWSTNRSVSSEPRLVVSDSSGAVTALKLTANGLTQIGKWNSHGFEAWIAAFNYWNEDVFYSGGDDCVLKTYDARVGGAAVAALRGGHHAGVTTARAHTHTQHILLTGSYDEQIRTWDTRHLKQCVRSVSAGGGVWRLKWRPSGGEVVVAACMHGGARAVRGGDTLHHYTGHDSIVYGADWSHRADIVATCSFYDCQLHISDAPIQ